MSVYDCIPVEHHGMSEWTLLVLIFIGMAVTMAVTIIVKLLIMWKDAHDTHMCEQVKRIDAHDQQLNCVSTDLVVIKNDIGYVKNSLNQMKEPLNDMRELNQMVIAKVLKEKDGDT